MPGRGLSDRFRSAGDQIARVSPESLPGWMWTAGIGGWLIAGMAAALAIGGWFFVTSASVSIPLVLAMVIGMVAYPVCEKMQARGLHKSAAASVVLLLLVAIIVGVVWLVVAGVVSQWPNIQEQLQKGLQAALAQLEAWGYDSATLQAQFHAAEQAATSTSAATNPFTGSLLSSVGGALSAGISGLFSALFGIFIAVTLLYYVLADFPTIAEWIGGHMGLRDDLGAGIVEDAVAAMRGYFRGTTITGVAVAITIAIAMLIMRVPLAATVGVVTFLTCYIPYFGAIISGAFAFLVALGSNGLTTAIVLLVIVLLAQNVLQTVINAKVMGDSLNLHPLVVLVVTMLGGIFGGLLGAALGAPLAALFINAYRRLNAAWGPVARVDTEDEPAA